MLILFGQIHSEIKISFHGALRELAGKMIGSIKCLNKGKGVKIYVNFWRDLEEAIDPAEL